MWALGEHEPLSNDRDQRESAFLFKRSPVVGMVLSYYRVCVPRVIRRLGESILLDIVRVASNS